MRNELYLHLYLINYQMDSQINEMVKSTVVGIGELIESRQSEDYGRNLRDAFLYER